MCPDVKFSEELFSYIQEDIIDLEINDIKKIYDYWRQGDPGPGEMYKKERGKIMFGKDIPENAELLGIDLPIWFNTHDKKPRIMIIGRDPQRSKSAFENLNADPKKDVIISSPYAFHIPKLRCSKRFIDYWTFIRKLQGDYFVYITDAYKIFFKTGGLDSHFHIKKKGGLNLKETQSKLLTKEIKLIIPDLIITLGAESHEQLFGKKIVRKLSVKIDNNIPMFNNRIPVLPMIHLSRSVRGNWIHDFLNANGQEGNTDKGDAYFQIIDNYINNNVKNTENV